ncbi:efflux transporter outer membrane subunit [Polynucleobacter antarcticus]|uniref:efflux transporter outer membrane subunit n=1 Tax=Polynucleobacter antarcticus TaxID=1743162 RepID=UPI0015706D3E|nr:efflux transporter outer membrane subunit [Polynucleobacter antarcticus]
MANKSPAGVSRPQCKRLPLYLACLSLGLSACTSPIIKPGDAPPAAEYVRWLPKEFRAPVEASLPRPKELWWRDFESDELNQIVETGITNNYDLRVAVARVAQTRAQAGIVRSAEYPTIDAIGGYSIQAPYPAIGSAPNTAAWSSQGTWQAGALVNYEVNLWGKKGFDTQSAYSQALASEFNRDAVTLTLTGDIVTSYFQVVSLNERITVGQRNLDAIQELTRGLGRRVQLGDATEIDFFQQTILLNNTRAAVVGLQQQRERAFTRLATLVGITPSTLTVKGVSVDKVRVPVVEPGLPSDLLCRRPDIRRAEAMLESAKLDLYSARANLLPNFNLTGGAGFGSFLLSTLTAPQSLYYNITSNLLANIFDAGKRQSQIQLASAKNVEMLESYANTVLSSLREVEDSLSGIQLTARAYSDLSTSRDKAQRLTVMSQRVVLLGGMDFVQLYEIQRTVFNSEDAAIQARFDQLRASVDLFKAIGGGTKLQNDPCLGGTKLPAADARWAEAASKADKIVGPKPNLGIDSKGNMINAPAPLKQSTPN